MAQDQPELADIAVLVAVLDAYEPVLADAVELVARELGLKPSSRIKNADTIVSKLHRNGGHTLNSMQDLGGMRVVVDGGRAEQDEWVRRISQLFAPCEREPKVVDRRARPVHGYRAVHVVVYPSGYPIEIQVRTYWQHRWAEQFERMADQYGRGIRYGETPTPDYEFVLLSIDQMMRVADSIAALEAAGEPLPSLGPLSDLLKWSALRQSAD